MVHDTSKIIAQNVQRWKTLRAPYDPIAGIGSPVPRREFRINRSVKVFLPVDMMSDDRIKCFLDYPTFEEAIAVSKIDLNAAYGDFAKIRCGYDFEFWCSTCVIIKAKRGTKGTKVKFILNRPQRKLLAVLEKMRLSGVSIRVILLKARQWGGSTLVQIYIAWLQLFHRKDWNGMIVADAKDKAHNIRAMYKLLVDMHPQGIVDEVEGKLRLTSWESTQNFKQIPGRGNLIGVASVENPNAPRSFTTHLLHLSEVGLWKSTPSVNAEALAAALEGGIVDGPYTLCIKESTAKGVGNYFHREWQKATKKEIDDVPVFVSWFEDPEDYNIEVKKPVEFIKSWSDYESFLWDSGASLEHIAWYRSKRKKIGSDWQMQSEFPTTPQEAFQSTGNRIFAPDIVLRARSTCRDPIAVGNLIANTIKGEGTFRNIHFVPSPGGYLSIWKYPHQLGVERSGKIYLNRYCAFLDTGGKSEGADWNSLTVLDRILTLWGGVPYVCAEFHGHLDPDLVAWYAARVSRFYGDALLAVEVNKLYKDSGDAQRGYEADYSLTVLDEIKDYYKNLFYRVKPEQIQDRWSGVLGFHTNKETKPILIKELNASLRDRGYEERNIAACDEYDFYEQKKDGTMGAVEGQHDDRVISRGGAVWLSAQMDPVKEIDPKDKQTTARPGGFGIF